MSMLLPLIEPEQEQRTDVWAYISPSRLNTWLSCPLKFKLRYVDGIRSPPTPSLFLGKQVHAGLETYYRHRQLGIKVAATEVASRMLSGWEQAAAEEGMEFESVAAESALKAQAEQLVTAYLGQVSAEEPVPLAVEATLEAPLIDPRNGEDLGISMLGIVDLILNEPSGPNIIDFKTSSRSAPPFEVTHEVQLSCYAYLFRAATGRSEASLEIRSLVKTKQPKIETHQYPSRSTHHLLRLFAIIREYLDALDSGRINYRPGWGCGMCDFRDTHCRTWAD